MQLWALSLYKDSIHWVRVLLLTSFNLYYFLKGPLSPWASLYEFGGRGRSLIYSNLFCKGYYREFPGSLVIRTGHFHCSGLGSTLDWGTKVLKVVQRLPPKGGGITNNILALSYGLRLHISHTAWSKKRGGVYSNNSLFVIITWFISTDITQKSWLVSFHFKQWLFEEIKTWGKSFLYLSAYLRLFIL